MAIYAKTPYSSHQGTAQTTSASLYGVGVLQSCKITSIFMDNIHKIKGYLSF